jgi:hypothetical protein
MALNFPNNPQTGDTYLAPNNQTYLYDGEKWIGFITPAGTIAQGITFVGDDSTGTRVSDGESFKIAGTQNVSTAVSGDTLTITGPNLSSYATQSYVTSQGYITNSPITVVGDDSTGVTLNSGETIKIAGTQNVSTAVSGDTLTITGPNLSSYLTNSTLTIVGDDSTGVTLNAGETIKIAGAGSITTAVSGDTLTITGSKDINVNSITSSDSSAIQINDGVNVSGVLNAKTLITNTISSEDSTAIQVNDGLRISGDLTFSDNTVQTTAYVPADNLVKVSGTWTVTTGTNTYSFTVPADGTYTMWVKGNIANGIIIWNATVSVSNTNVPAIGTQYAWNYTGGGSPISLTGIPGQIRGSAGTISTDNTYAGGTSNRFDFGISNTSGSSQTIYYGYTKIS